MQQRYSGFASSAGDYVQSAIDLNAQLILRPAATFFIRFTGPSHSNFGLRRGDVLIVDRSLQPIPNRLVVSETNGELTVTRFRNEPAADIVVWGVVTYIIRSESGNGGWLDD